MSWIAQTWLVCETPLVVGLWDDDWAAARCARHPKASVRYTGTTQRGTLARFCVACETRLTPDVGVVRVRGVEAYGLLPEVTVRL